MIFRKQVQVGEYFDAPENITVGFQEMRKEFSIWFIEGIQSDRRYIIVGTGHEIRREIRRLVGTIVMPDGFHVFHLVEVDP